MASAEYRPQKFSQVLGQSSIVKTLKNALSMNRVASAYIFTGSRGTGKTTLARILAKALNCLAPEANGEPCGVCTSCREIAESRSLDVLEIDGASNRGIDDIRNINETVGYATTGKCKVYIIDEVHMLTKEAFNALLKTLEEPPPNVKFFFATTEPHKVLPTILSRTQRFDLARITSEEISQKLSEIAKKNQIDITSEALTLIAQLAEGGLRDAESLFDQMVCFADKGTISEEIVVETLGLAPKDDFFALDEAASQFDLPFAFTLAEKIFKSGKDLVHFLESLAEHYRTHLLLKLSQKPPLLHKEEYQKNASYYTKEQCFYILDYLMQCLEKMPKHTFKQLHLEIILLHIIRSMKRLPIDALVQKLEELKKDLPPNTSPSPIENSSKETCSTAPKEVAPVPKEDLTPTSAITPNPVKDTPSTKEENLLRFASVELNGTLKQ